MTEVAVIAVINEICGKIGTTADYVIPKLSTKEPYNLERTGCKGCPFALDLQEELDMLEKYFPNERKQCEIIWKPVYDEYRRLGYRLRKV